MVFYGIIELLFKKASEIMSKKAFTIRMDDDDYERLKYWSQKRGITINEYMNEALQFFIKYENKDYDLHTAEVIRLNQLVDAIASLSANQKNLETVIVSGFESLLSLTRGDNYLLDEDI